MFFDHTAKLGGGEIAMLNLVTHLDTSRYVPLVLLAGDGSLAHRLRAAGIETIILPLPPSVIETRKDSLSVGSLLKMRGILACIWYAWGMARLARRRNVDIIHCNSLKADVIGGIAGIMARKPTLWHIRDHINEEYLPARVAQVFRALARKIPNGVLANSNSTLEELGLQVGRSEKGAYRGIAYSGIPTEEFISARATGREREDGVSRIVLVGRISPWKGQDVFLRAAAKVTLTHPKARFQIVGTAMFGETEYDCRLRELAQKLGVESVTEFLGFREDIPKLLAEATIVAHASVIGEPFGRVVVEGMAAGKPIVATDGGALREIVTNGPVSGPPSEGETGLLVPMGDADAMADAICALLSDRARAAAMGAAGRRRVEELFTIEHTVRCVEIAYEELLGIRRDPPDTPGCEERRVGPKGGGDGRGPEMSSER